MKVILIAAALLGCGFAAAQHLDDRLPKPSPKDRPEHLMPRIAISRKDRLSGY